MSFITIKSVSFAILTVLPGMLLAQKAPVVEIIREVKHGVSMPVREIRANGPVEREGEADHGPYRLPITTLRQVPLRDLAMQSAQPRQLAPLTILNFAGLGNGAYGSSDVAIPPDTNGSPGLTQYVQWVNGEFAIFDKSTGGLIAGPTAGNALWQSLGGSDPCASTNAGDIIAQYDKIANRWVLSQFTGENGPPYYQCFAISQTADATGAYWLYEFAFTDYFNDYPKIGVWPDGYYTTYNMFNIPQGGAFEGGRTCAYQRSAMLVGNTATSQCFTLPTYGGLLPSDLDGPTPPPANAPNYVVGLDGSLAQLDMWSFHVDWNTPGNSTFTGPHALPVTAFTPACYGAQENAGTCIQQPGTTEQLDSLGDRMMYRLAYRNLGDHEALLVNHSVDAATGTVGVRWYEIRNPSSSPFIYQQSTYSPDTDSRWMASMVMDHSGNIALGYGVSSSATFPSVRFTGRLASDALNTMESETTMVTGSGSQIPQGGSPGNRWGDYSNFSVDPVDDCTLWYTHEYMSVTADFAWSTRIGNLKFSTCQAINQNPDFSIAATPAFSVYQGATAVISISTTVQNGFNSALALTASGAPAGTTPTFSTTTIPAPGSGNASLTIPILAGTLPGSYSIVITGTGGAKTHHTTVQLTVLTSGAYNALGDGGFEQATQTGTAAPGWIGAVSTPGHNLVIFQGAHSHTGSNYASFSGNGGVETDSLTQTIAIPAGITTANLSFWTNVTTSLVGSTVQDTLAVTIQDGNGIIHPGITLSNLDSLSDSNTLGQYFQPSQVSLAPWAGQTVKVIFTSFTGSTTFLVDDVALDLAQAGGSCAFTLNPGTVYFDANPNSGSAGVAANLPYCSWLPVPDANWITITSTVGIGTAPFGINVIANPTGASRSGHIAVGVTTLTVTQDATVQVFSDVAPSAYYFDAVNLFKQKNITSGCGPTTYCPASAVTRAQMAIFIVRTMLGTDNFPYSPTPYFTDVPSGAFGFPWIQKFYELGITGGCGPQLFCPNGTVTRQQMAIFIVRARFGATTAFDYTLTPYFTDVPANAFAFNYIQRMREDNITAGCGPGLYCPLNPVLRGDMAIFIMRGGFNVLLPAGQPYLSQLSQSTIPNGTGATLTVTGVSTNFLQGSTVVNPVAGMTFGTPTVTSSTSFTVPVNANAATTPSPVSIWVTTGVEEAVFPNGIQIQ